MEMTWESSWKRFEEYSGFGKRDGQTTLGQVVFENVFNGGQLCAEGPTGTGKSIALLIPAIAAFQQKKQRTIVTTETLSLLDQLVDKDLPFLQKALGNFKYFGLKGRNHYLCIAKAGRNNEIVQKVSPFLEGTLGERRDIERILKRRLDDEEWSDISGETDFCAHNRCTADVCYSTNARKLAEEADIVVTSHTMLQIQGEFIQRDGEGLLGEFTHIMVDEAHSLEKVVISGATFEYGPWDIAKKMNDLSKGVSAVSIPELYGFFDELDKRIKDSLHFIQEFMEYQGGKHLSVQDWGRECFPLALTYVNNVSMDHAIAMDAYEQTLPHLLDDIVEIGTDIQKHLVKEFAALERGKGTVSKAITAVSSLVSFFGLIRSAATNVDGVVEAYGTTYALFVDGHAGQDINGRPKKNIIIRAVPLDVSNFLRKNLWEKSRSVTLVSATLRDMTDGSFRFLKRSLGVLKDAKECVVDSPFDFKNQQMIYLTDGEQTDDVPDLSGARFSEGELIDLIKASKGRSLVLFTSMKELLYVKDLLDSRTDIPWTVLAQERGVDKSELAKSFKEDTHSILLGSNSFVQGFDVPGEALSQVILVKWFNPRYDPVMKAQIKHWRSKGFPNYYTMRSMGTTVQALGRGVRSDECKVVCSILDNRVAKDKNSVKANALHVMGMLYPASPVVSDINSVKTWLS